MAQTRREERTDGRNETIFIKLTSTCYVGASAAKASQSVVTEHNEREKLTGREKFIKENL